MVWALERMGAEKMMMYVREEREEGNQQRGGREDRERYTKTNVQK